MKRAIQDFVFYMVDGTYIHLMGQSPKAAFDRKFKKHPQPQFYGFDVSKVPLRVWNPAYSRWERKPRELFKPKTS